MNKKGVTMIEALLASTIISLSLVGYMQYKKVEMEEDLVKEFEYDLNKVMDSFSHKIIKDGLDEKKYWTNLQFNENINDHLLINLTDVDKGCEGLSVLDLNHVNYISCVPPLRLNYFNVDTNGGVYFDNDDIFKSYVFNFIPKDQEEFKKIKILQKALKRVLNDTFFYSNVNFFIGEEKTTYVNCLNKSDKCYLKMTFGKDYDYLKSENKIKVLTQNDNDEMIHYNSGYKLLEDEYNSEYEFEYNDDYNEEKSEGDELKKHLNKNGIKLSNKEYQQLEDEIERIKNDPELMGKIEKELERACSQYDEDDYYFMSKYKKDDPCYQTYGK